MSVFLQYYDLAADVLAENAHLTYKFLKPVSISTLFFKKQMLALRTSEYFKLFLKIF